MSFCHYYFNLFTFVFFFFFFFQAEDGIRDLTVTGVQTCALPICITVAEVTFSNSISVSEHVVMMILSLVRNYIPSYQWVVNGGWNIADCVSRSYDLEGMDVGTVGAGRIGTAVMRRLKPFEVRLHYTDRHQLPDSVEQELNATFHPSAESLVSVCDVVTINTPLHSETEH